MPAANELNGRSERDAARAVSQALNERLRLRARALLAGEHQVLAQLAAARTQIMQTLAGLPSDWQQWHLSQLLGQIQSVLDGATRQAGILFDDRLRALWQQGEAMVDASLAAGGWPLATQLPLLDVRVLGHLRQFASLRLRDVGTEVATQIGRELGLVTLGVRGPFEAMGSIQRRLAGPTVARASTIVRTELGRAFALAAEQRLEQAAERVPGLQKQWRRSGKVHSRWSHDLMDGQVVDVGTPFKVPNPGGGFDLMSGPHDPRAPAEQVINCGCLALPWIKQWQVMTPGAKPFSERELQLDGGKAALDAAAKRAGRRGGGSNAPSSL